MSYVIINGNKYDVPEMNFDAVCELEERGVNLLNADMNNVKIATMARGLVAWIMDVDVQTASKEIEAHIANGGNIVDIVSRVTDAINNSGFFKQGGRNHPQDHREKQKEKVTQYPQNREQRRKSKRKGNGSR